MSWSRREMMLAGLGLFVGGCTSRSTRMGRLPRTAWPKLSVPRSGGGVAVEPPPPEISPPLPDTEASPSGLVEALGAHRREEWSNTHAIASRVNPMNGISRATVHHEGWKPVWFTSLSQTKERLRMVREAHVQDRGWGDVGYHFIIDRAGRIWEARDHTLQGAHVHNHNKHNLGIMCLGNFDEQQPSRVQLRALIGALQVVMDRYSISVSRVYTHQELNPTRCPGSHLQPRVVAMRHSGALA